MPVYELSHTTDAHMIDKLKDIILRMQDDTTTILAPPIMVDLYAHAQSLPRNSSRNSLDSADSNTMEDTQSTSELTAISEQWGGVGGGVGGGVRSISPTSKSDLGVNLRVKRSSVTLPRNILKELDGASQYSSESDTGSSRTSDDITRSSEARPRFERRHTLDPTSHGYLSLGRKNAFPRSPMNLYGGGGMSPTASMGSMGGSPRVKIRANPSTMNTLRVPRRQQSNNTAILTNDKTKVKMLKIILAGDDGIISGMAKAFAYLRVKEPTLFLNLNFDFYYVPLSRASSGWAGSHSATPGAVLYEPPQPALEEGREELGNDIQVGRYLGHMDSWYEMNVMLAIHNTLGLIPDVSYAQNGW